MAFVVVFAAVAADVPAPLLLEDKEKHTVLLMRMMMNIVGVTMMLTRTTMSDETIRYPRRSPPPLLPIISRPSGAGLLEAESSEWP